MSDDRTTIVRNGRNDRFFYSRWGGSHVELNLLRGRDLFLADLHRDTAVEQPFLETWLCGLIFIDTDRRMLRVWSSQSIARAYPSQQLFSALLQHAWPGWDACLLHEPALQLATLLPQHRPSRALEAPQPLSAEDFANHQRGPWLERNEDEDLRDHIKQLGEASVRRWFEFSTHHSVVFIEDDHNIHETTLADGWDCRDLLRTGPEAIDILRQRPILRFEDSLSWNALESVYQIDVRNKHITRWVGQSRWARPLSPMFSLWWPGWRLEWAPDGAAEIMDRCRRPQPVWTTQTIEETREALQYRLKNRGPDPALAWVQPVAEQWLATRTT